MVHFQTGAGAKSQTPGAKKAAAQPGTEQRFYIFTSSHFDLYHFVQTAIYRLFIMCHIFCDTASAKKPPTPKIDKGKK